MIVPEFTLRYGNVPVLSDKEIDRYAENAVRDYNPELLKQPLPLDIEDFAENYLGLKLHFENLSHNEFIWGRMVFDNRQIPVWDNMAKQAEFCPVEKNTILVDNSLLAPKKENLFRSTIGHECGHYIYHPEYFLNLENDEIGATKCRATDIVGDKTKPKWRRRFKTDIEWIEHHAKYFSAALLMPKSTVKMAVEAWNDRYFEAANDYGYDIARLFFTDFEVTLPSFIAETFKVSEASAKIRLDQLKLGIYAENIFAQNKKEVLF